MFMGSAVFVGFLQNPDGLVFFVFSNIAGAITSRYNIAGGLFFQDLGFREGLFSQELSDFESSISGFFDLIRVSSSGCWPQGSGNGIEVWFKFVAAAFYLYDGQFLAQKERERIWHWQQQG